MEIRWGFVRGEGEDDGDGDGYGDCNCDGGKQRKLQCWLRLLPSNTQANCSSQKVVRAKAISMLGE